MEIVALGRQPRFSHADKIVFPRRLLLNGAIEIEKVSGSERERENAKEICNNCRLYSQYTASILLNNGSGGNIHFTFHLSPNLIRPTIFSVFFFVLLAPAPLLYVPFHFGSFYDFPLLYAAI